MYTRKSTEEGLEQDYNSIDAQRDAGQAYIASQRHEGWIPVATDYDDPAYSGGNMERPALKRLMQDIHAKLIDVVVVYKIDRLTRSLADFSKMVEVFDAHGLVDHDYIDELGVNVLHQAFEGRALHVPA